MKKLIWTLVILVVVGVFGGRAWYLHKQAEQNKDAIKIGVLSVLSGPYSFIGNEAKNGVTLAIEELKGTIPEFSFALSVEDGKGKTKEAISGYNKLLFDNVDVAIVIGDNQVPVVTPLVIENSVPTIGTIVGTQNFLEQNKDKTYLFLNWPSSYIGSTYVGQFAKNDLKLERVALFYMAGPLGEESAKGFHEGFGKDYVAEEKFRESDLDLKSQVAKILYHNPDGVFVIGYGAGLTTAFNQLKEAQYKGVILSDDKAGDANTKAVTKDLSNIYYADTANTDNELSKHFCETYQKRFGTEPSGFARTGYDSVMRIAKAIELKGKDNIREGLAELKEMDTTSGHLKFLPNGAVEFPLVIKQMQADGSAKIVKE